MNKFVLNGIASAMVSLGVCSPSAAQAYNSYTSRSYIRSTKMATSELIKAIPLDTVARQQVAGPSTLATDNATPLLSVAALVQRSSSATDIILHSPPPMPTYDSTSGIAHVKAAEAPDIELISLDPVRELVIIDQAVADKHLFYKDLKLSLIHI